MLFIILRAVNAIFAVAVAILVSQRFGDSGVGKMLTVLITATVVAFFEWLLIWAPKHFPSIRRFLDPRSIFAGVWIQDVVRVYGKDGPKQDFPNRGAVLSISYREPIDNYRVEGTAYDDSGNEHSRWESTEVIHFAKDGRSVTYEWSGTVTNLTVGREDPRRTGFCHMTLSSADGGRGRVDHVAVDVLLEFNLTRVTQSWLHWNKLDRFRLEDLYNPNDRDQFAVALANSRAKAVSAAASAGTTEKPENAVNR